MTEIDEMTAAVERYLAAAERLGVCVMMRPADVWFLVEAVRHLQGRVGGLEEMGRRIEAKRRRGRAVTSSQRSVVIGQWSRDKVKRRME